MTTSRASRLTALLALISAVVVGAALVAFACFYARPALIEIWHHGYRSGSVSAEGPDWNWLPLYFLADYPTGAPVDSARVGFNIVLRFVSVYLVLMIALVAASCASESIWAERQRSTWDSLIATALSAHDILRSKLLGALWRVRYAGGLLLLLWTSGLAAGSIHPLGYIAAIVYTSALCWPVLSFGLFVSVRAATVRATNIALLMFSFILVILTGSGALPHLLPARFRSVFLGAGSPGFVTYISLISYREFHTSLADGSSPTLRWIGLSTGEGPLAVVATWLIASVASSLIGLWLWRSTNANFDRLIGRPFRSTQSAKAGARTGGVPPGICPVNA